jgi:hypothetical protein
MHLLFQAYGSEAVLRQTVFCIRSLAYTTAQAGADFEDYTLVVYTDVPAYFRRSLADARNLRLEPLHPDQLRAWRGPADFVHRAKICLLQAFFDKYNAPVCYLDSDTLFVRNPAPLFATVAPGTSLMHIMEETLEQPQAPLLQKIGRFVRRQPLRLHGNTFRIPLHTAMWNAGVLGLHPTHALLLPDVLRLTDQLYNHYPKHLMEQLAFSYLLQEHTTVMAAAPYVFHYWNLKEALDARIESHLAGQLPLHAFMQHDLPTLQLLAQQPRPTMLGRLRTSLASLRSSVNVW